MGPKPQKPATPPAKPPARAPAGPGTRPGAAADGEPKSWLRTLGALALLAGLLGLIYKLYIDKPNCNRKLCPKIDPKVLKWPVQDKSWVPWSKIKKAWCTVKQYIQRSKLCS